MGDSKAAKEAGKQLGLDLITGITTANAAGGEQASRDLLGTLLRPGVEAGLDYNFGDTRSISANAAGKELAAGKGTPNNFRTLADMYRMPGGSVDNQVELDLIDMRTDKLN